METKECRTCLVSLPVETGFYWSAKKPKPTVNCKGCLKARDKRYRLERPEHYRAKKKAYQQRPEVAKKRNEDSKAYAKTNRVIRNAHQAVLWALRRGEISKLPCEVCGEENSEAHHDDYEKRTDVRWLCRLHHVQWHKANGPAKNDGREKF